MALYVSNPAAGPFVLLQPHCSRCTGFKSAAALSAAVSAKVVESCNSFCPKGCKHRFVLNHAQLLLKYIVL